MGTKNSKLNYDITLQLNQDHRATRYRKKLLILGAPKSGKSTLFYRLKLLHGGGFTHSDRMQMKSEIYQYLIFTMQQILRCLTQYKYSYKLSEIGQQISQILLDIDLRDYEDIHALNINHSNDIMTYLEILSHEAIIQHIIANRYNYCYHYNYFIDDCIEYFLHSNTIQRLNDYTNYLPTDTDIISFERCKFKRKHRKNNHLCEARINVRNDTFILYDINYDMNNGVNKGSKWMHCFDNVTALIFVASLCSYRETIVNEEQCYLNSLKIKVALDCLVDIIGNDIVELLMTFVVDPSLFGKNTMQESIQLFDHVINNKYFYDTPIILMLNKKDLFQRNIQMDDDVLSFIQCFPEFTNLVCYDWCRQYIQQQFQSQNKNEERHIYTHCASFTSDNNLVERLFNDVQSIVLENCLRMGNHI